MTRFVKRRLLAYFNDPPVVPPAVPPTVPPPPPPVAGKTFTQEQVNDMMAAHKRTLQTENQELVKQLETLRGQANLTQQQKDELDARITTLSQQHLSTEQRLTAQIESDKKKAAAAIEASEAEKKKWHGEFNSLLVKNSVLLGSSTHKAANTGQMLALLSPQAKVVEVVDDKGQPTGTYTVKIPMAIADAKTKAVTVVDMEMVEAIGKMREQTENANLFLFDGKPGIGGTNNNTAAGGNGGTPDIANMTPDQYMEFRKQQKANRTTTKTRK